MKTITNYHRNFYNIRKLDDNSRYETSLMISQMNLKFLNQFLKKFKNLKNLLSHLVNNYDRLLKIENHVGGKVLTKYQKKGLELKKINFMPHSKDWLALKNIAFHYGISISMLFSILFGEYLKDQNGLSMANRRVPVLSLKISKKLIFLDHSMCKYLQYSVLKL